MDKIEKWIGELLKEAKDVPEAKTKDGIVLGIDPEAAVMIFTMLKEANELLKHTHGMDGPPFNPLTCSWCAWRAKWKSELGGGE